MTTTAYDKQQASEIIARFDARGEMLVQILHAFIERFAWIPEDAIRQLADELNLSRAEVHGGPRCCQLLPRFPDDSTGQTYRQDLSGGSVPGHGQPGVIGSC